MTDVPRLLPRDRLLELVNRFPQVRLAVVGDYFLDRYLVIDPQLDEPSVETGLTAHQVVAIRNSPGAAGTVINNLVALRCGSPPDPARLHAVGVIGDDAYGFELTRLLRDRGVNVDRLLAAADRFTPTYTKPLQRTADGEIELERLDIRNRTPTPFSLREQVLRNLEEIVSQVDGVIVLDQVVDADTGVVTASFREALALIADRPENANIRFYADSRAFADQFRNVLLKINLHEALLACGMDPNATVTDSQIEAIASALSQKTGRAIFLTLGPRGILVVDQQRTDWIPTVRLSGPVDVTGAGDSATAGILLALCAGATLAQAALIGNLVASITVEQLRTTGTASPAQLLCRYDLLVEQTSER